MLSITMYVPVRPTPALRDRKERVAKRKIMTKLRKLKTVNNDALSDSQFRFQLFLCVRANKQSPKRTHRRNKQKLMRAQIH